MNKAFVVLLLLSAIMTSPVKGEDNSSGTNAPPAKQAPAIGEHDFYLKGIGTLYLTYPKDWVSSFKPVANLPVNQIVLTPNSHEEFAVVVDAITKGDQAVQSFDLNEALTKAAGLEAARSVEQKLDVHDFKSASVIGAWAALTDKSVSDVHPKPGEFKYLTLGYAKLSPLVLSFRIVSNRLYGDENSKVIEMIKSARLVPTDR